MLHDNTNNNGNNTNRVQLSYCAVLDALQQLKTKQYNTQQESGQTKIMDSKKLAPNYTNIPLNAGDSAR